MTHSRAHLSGVVFEPRLSHTAGSCAWHAGFLGKRRHIAAQSIVRSAMFRESNDMLTMSFRVEISSETFEDIESAYESMIRHAVDITNSEPSIVTVFESENGITKES